MLSRVCGRLASALRGTRAPPSAVTLRCLHASSSRPSTDKSERTEKPPRAFDQALLEFLVCPLSKKPLRAHRKMALPSLPAVRWSHVTRFQLMECEGRCLLPQPSLDFAVRKKSLYCVNKSLRFGSCLEELMFGRGNQDNVAP